MNRNLPLGLPEGSVRALLAILLTLTCCWLWLTGQTVPNELLAFAGVVVAYYFKTRADEITAARADLLKHTERVQP